MKFRFGTTRKNKITSFSIMLPDVMEDLNIKDSFIIRELNNKWSSYVGNILSTHSYPERIFNQNLFINVDHSAYASELSIHKNELLKKIKNDFGDNIIKSIKFETRKSRWRNS